jgi:hypothetical protein
MEWLQASSLAVFIHKTAWAFTTIELVHVFAISLVIGTIAIVDLRLLGLGTRKGTPAVDLDCLRAVRGVQEWDLKPTPPLPARLAGGMSLTCWALVVIFGRWTGFTMLPE